jgi:hypothetical protein
LYHQEIHFSTYLFGLGEQWIGSGRREKLHHIIALHEEHLRRVMRDYVSYHPDDRLHDSLEKDAPTGRAIEPRPGTNGTVISMPRAGRAAPSLWLASSCVGDETGFRERTGRPSLKSPRTKSAAEVSSTPFVAGICPTVPGNLAEISIAPVPGSLIFPEVR